MAGHRRNWLGRAFMAGLVAATAVATPIAAGAAVVGDAQPDFYAVAEDSALATYDVLANDTPGATIVSFDDSATTKGTVGTVIVLQQIVQLSYTPDPDAYGTDTFDYTVEVDGVPSTATVEMTITSSPDAPVAEDDELPLTGQIQEDEDPIDVTADLLANDSDADEGQTAGLVIIAAGPAASGTVVFDGDTGAVSYEPTSQTATTDSFTYTIWDGSGEAPSETTTATATATITITAIDDAPVAVDDGSAPDLITVVEGGEVTFNVLDNDTDVDGGPIEVVDNTEPTNASAFEITPAGEVTYVHDGGDTTNDSFDYTLNGDASATVSITVTPFDDAPVAVDDGVEPDLITINENDVDVVIDVLANDTDIDGGPLEIIEVSTPNIGTATILETDGSDMISYDHAGDDLSDVTFTYTLNGGDTGDVTIKVANADDDAPVVADVDLTILEDAGATIVPVLAKGQTDADGTVLFVNHVSDASNGVTSLDENGVVTYTPNENVSGPDAETVVDTFVVHVSDGTGDHDAVVTVSVAIEPVNDPPVAKSDSYENTSDYAYVYDDLGGYVYQNLLVVIEDRSVELPLLENDSDVEDDDLSVDLESINIDPSVGVVEGSENGILFTPAPDFSGSFGFSYRITDGKDSSDFAYVDVYVIPTPDPTITGDDFAEVAEDDVVYVDVLDNDTDADHPIIDGPDFRSFQLFDRSELNIVDVVQPDDGYVAIAGDRLRVEPDPNFNGTLFIVYAVQARQDPVWNGNSYVTTCYPDSIYDQQQFLRSETSPCQVQYGFLEVEVGQVNDRPEAIEDSASTDEDEAVIIDVLANDGDIDGDDLAIWGVGPARIGTTEIVDGKIVYTPNADEFGTDSFVYYATDGLALSVASVDVEVAPVLDPPTIEDELELSGPEDEPVVFEVTIDDVDSEDLTVTIGDTPTVGSVDIDGTTVTYTPPANWFGNVDFTLVVTDDELSATGTMSIEITSVNDEPYILAAEADTDEDTAVTIPITFWDIEDDNMTIAIAADPDNGTAVIDGRNVVYTPDDDYFGPDSLTVSTTDSDNATTEATVTIDVASINDEPTALACDGVTVESGTSITIDVSACANDVDGDRLVIAAASTAAATGSVVESGSREVTYTAKDGFEGSDAITSTLIDGKGGEVEITIAVTVEVPVNPYVGAAGLDGEVVRIYSAMLGRLPDAGGFAYWTELRANGLSLEQMIELFANSPEFTSLFGDRMAGDTDGDWVDFVYLEIMNRNPDAPGRAYWLDLLGRGLISRSGMIVWFAESPEYQAITQTT